MNLFEKVEKVRALIKGELGIDEDALMKILSKLSNKWQYRGNRRKSAALSKDELALYELLVGNCYNPSTVYKWMLLEKSPDVVRYKLEQGLIGVREAFREKTKHRMYAHMSNRDFIDAVIRCIELYYVEPAAMEGDAK